MRVAILSLIALLVAGCAEPRHTSPSLPLTSNSGGEQKLRWLYSANPQRDLKEALSRGDRRFIGVYGFAPTVPGIGPENPLCKRYGVRYLEGTSDAITSEEDYKLNDLAEKYAEKYNLLLVQHLRRGHPAV